MTTSSTVRIERESQLVESNIAFMRQIDINWTLTACRPNAVMYPFFDKKDVSIYVKQTGKNYGDPIITDSTGSASGVFSVPANTFRTGEREFLFSELRNHYELENVKGAIFGFAKAKFASNGIARGTQITETRVTINTTERVDVRWFDPVAQSFHTFGYEGGVFLHSIDLYFKNKSNTVPLEVVVVEMKYGVPSNDPKDIIGRKILQPSEILTNPTMVPTIATRIVFDDLLYLEPDKEYAFIVMAPNTNEYYLFSAYLGEKSFETGTTIFQQNYLGSMFKSQNNSTWTPYQEEDLKFAINICDFNTNVGGNVTLKSFSPSRTIESSKFTTVSGSNIVTVTLPHKHGFRLEQNDKLELFVPPGVYNGIPAASLSGTFNLTEIIDEYSFRFQAGAAATSTGPIISGRQVRSISVVAGGSNYDDNNPPTVTISGGGGSGATATAIVRNGKVVGVKLTNPGSGYTSSPTVSFSSITGGGAQANAVLFTLFTIITNTVFHEVMPALDLFTPEKTDYEGTLQFRLGYDQDSGITQYQPAKPIKLEQFKKYPTEQNTLVANVTNQNTSLGGTPSGSINLVLSSKNRNVSPVLNTERTSVYAYENIVNYDTSDSELQAGNGLSLARYITKPNRLLNVSTGVRFFCNAYSTENTDIEVYLKASQSASDTPHEEHDWVKLKCDVERNKSKQPGEFFDYTFYYDKFPGGFDVYQFKIILKSKFKWEVPIVKNFRSIILL